MSSQPLVRLRGVGKAYPKMATSRQRLRVIMQLLRGSNRYPSSAVLKDVSLEISPGRSLGVVGVNGAGKSTLLKLMTGILTPTWGTVEVNARIGALIELGAGFHPEYNGRDNLRMAAALQGLSAREIEEKTPEIIEFADIGDAIDEPVKHYSSGMVVRLGFAIVAVTRPQLLITDEVLAVGDESFQKKCIAWMERYLADGGTLILVSHGMYHVQKLCSEACWIHDGGVRAYGDVYDVTQDYLSWHERQRRDEQTREQAQQAGRYAVTSLVVNGHQDLGVIHLAAGADLTLDIQLHSPDARPPAVHVGIVRIDGTPVYGVTSEVDGAHAHRLEDDIFAFRLTYPGIPLMPGTYTVRAHAMDPEGVRLLDTVEREVVVRGESRDLGIVQLAHEWQDPKL